MSSTPDESSSSSIIGIMVDIFVSVALKIQFVENSITLQLDRYSVFMFKLRYENEKPFSSGAAGVSDRITPLKLALSW